MRKPLDYFPTVSPRKTILTTAAGAFETAASRGCAPAPAHPYRERSHGRPRERKKFCARTSSALGRSTFSSGGGFLFLILQRSRWPFAPGREKVRPTHRNPCDVCITNIQWRMGTVSDRRRSFGWSFSEKKTMVNLDPDIFPFANRTATRAVRSDPNDILISSRKPRAAIFRHCPSRTQHGNNRVSTCVSFRRADRSNLTRRDDKSENGFEIVVTIYLNRLLPRYLNFVQSNLHLMIFRFLICFVRMWETQREKPKTAVRSIQRRIEKFKRVCKLFLSYR